MVTRESLPRLDLSDTCQTECYNQLITTFIIINYHF